MEVATDAHSSRQEEMLSALRSIGIRLVDADGAGQIQPDYARPHHPAAEVAIAVRSRGNRLPDRAHF